MTLAVPQNRATLGRGTSVVDGFIVAAILVVAIYAAGDVLAPLALAVILAFILTPPIQFVRRLGVPRTVATLVVVLTFLGGALALGTVLTSQVASLADDLPRYQSTLQQKIRDLRGAGIASQSMSRAGDALQQLQTELTKTEEQPGAAPVSPNPSAVTPLSPNLQSPGSNPAVGDAPGGSRSAAENNQNPVPVVIRPPPETALDQLKAILNIIIQPAAAAGLVILFLLFILLQREDVRDRTIRLLGTNDLGRSTSALNESAERLSRFLLAQTAANAAFGAVIGTALYFIGVPSPILWGIVAALMRFVPFVGSIIAAVFPVILAAAVDPGWTTVALTIALFVIAEPLMGHVVDPMIQGRATGMTPLAVILSTVFWTMMWGPIGLVLAVPVTLVLVVFGKHIKQLEVFNVLLGDDEALSPSQSFYQRMLSGDADEAAEQAERLAKEKTLAGYFDDVAIPGLSMAAADFESGSMESTQAATIDETIAEMLENLSDDPAAEVDSDEAAAAARQKVVCVAARSEIDMAGARLLAHLLRSHDLDAVALYERDIPRDLPNGSIAVISDFGPPRTSSRTDFMIRRLRRIMPNSRLAIAKWRADSASAQAGNASQAAVAVTMAGAVEALGIDIAQRDTQEAA